MWGGAAVREYRLAKRGTAYGVSCGADGAYVGPVPLLERKLGPNDRFIWVPRGQSELESNLTDHYGLPIDISAKVRGLRSSLTL